MSVVLVVANTVPPTFSLTHDSWEANGDLNDALEGDGELDEVDMTDADDSVAIPKAGESADGPLLRRSPFVAPWLMISDLQRRLRLETDWACSLYNLFRL